VPRASELGFAALHGSSSDVALLVTRWRR
jgi:hypothetical protein